MPEKFVKLTKDGETIEVHPSVVENHKALGWKVVYAKAETEEDTDTESKKKAAAEAKAAEKKAAAEAKAKAEGENKK